MTEFKFSCARCGQHILAGANYQGLQIQCPACRASITVPSLAPSPIAPPAPEPIAVPAPVRQLPTTPQSRASGLAKASLILSIASLVIGPFGFIPGIICGHLAKGRMRKDPLLPGRKLATAGLLVGYGFVALTIVITGILFSVGFDAVRHSRPAAGFFMLAL